jgi:hypothetical protein
MIYFYVRSTGELESAIISLSGVKGKYIVYDLSTEHSKLRNIKLANLFSINYRYLSNNFFYKFCFIYHLLIRKSILSINYINQDNLKSKIINSFANGFIRDALIPPINSAWIGSCRKLYCEIKFRGLFSGVKIYVDMENNAIENFLEKIRECNDSNYYEAMIIGKNMNRHPDSLKIKEDLYAILKSKFKQVILIPHPRETEQELNIALNMGLIISNEYPLIPASNSKNIFVIASSVAEVLHIMKIPYYWIFYKEEFTVHGGCMGRFHEHSRYSFYSNLELEVFLNEDHISS